MPKYLIWIFTFLLLPGFLLAQDASTTTATGNPDESTEDTESEFIFRPTIGLGIGMLTYYGEISKGESTNNPLVNNLGYELRVTQSLNNYLDLSFHVMTGKVSANERSLDRNLNFESTITTGGIALAYNFDHLLKPDRIIDPFISVGIESMEFLSKTDLQDEFGNTYNYWSDGSIRNLAENDPNAENAIRIQRDYEYESDIRALNLDGFGAYDERTWAIPIGIGANMYISDKVSFRFGTTLHYTLTDRIDGLTDESLGNRQGDSRNDLLLFTNVNLNYNFGSNKRTKKDKDDPGPLLADVGDEDGDGVIDIEDACPQTPPGEPVDEKGCPFDSDEDGFVNHRDDEIDSPDSSYVDNRGVQMSEEQLERLYLAYIDTTGKYVVIKDTNFAATDGTQIQVKRRTSKTYSVKYGEFEGDLPESVANEILSLEGVTVEESDGKTTIYVGEETELDDAIKIKMGLKEKGIDTEEIVRNESGERTEVSLAYIEIDDAGEEREVTPPAGRAYRVQVGAFRNEPPNAMFEGLPKMVKIRTEDGLTRYYTGAYPSYSEAASAKIRIVQAGFEDAFVVPFKDGQKVRLTDAGATLAPDVNLGNASTGNNANATNVRFRVQIGAYEQDIPVDVIEKFMTLGDVDQQTGDDGITRYFIGDFVDYQQARNFMDTLEQQGVKGFVVGENDGNIISAGDAQRLIQGQ
ncbi:MAG: SPOR domain-containing protein [Salibacteraceae bacterium]